MMDEDSLENDNDDQSQKQRLNGHARKESVGHKSLDDEMFESEPKKPSKPAKPKSKTVKF